MEDYAAKKMVNKTKKQKTLTKPIKTTKKKKLQECC